MIRNVIQKKGTYMVPFWYMRLTLFLASCRIALALELLTVNVRRISWSGA